jgi:uncharacterized Zn-binding protein involved in type VI secretion
MVTGTVPHVGGPVLPPGAGPQVLIGGFPAARMGDMATCAGPPDSIVKGAFPVPIANNPAARQTDSTVHGGQIALGCFTVLIGLSGTAGNRRVGNAMCQAAAGGRSSGSTQQTAQNCGVESSRQVINQANGTAVSESNLLQNSINNGLADGTPGVPWTAADGGTSAVGRQAILQSQGVSSTVQANTLENLGLAAARGQGTIANLDPAILWGSGTPGGGHAVTVTGVEYDDAGNVKNVYINDTGTGQCDQPVDVNTWNNAVAAKVGGSSLNVTNTPIW